MLHSKNIKSKTSIHINTATEGESMIDKMRRVLQQNEPIDDGAPLIYTEKAEGVRPEFDIRTDRFELALQAVGWMQDKIAKQGAGAPTTKQPGESKQQENPNTSEQTDNKE